MIRVLHIPDSMNVGGLETFIMNVYRCIDKDKIQFDIFSADKSCNSEEEIVSLGGNVYYTLPKKRHLFRYTRDLFRVLRKNKYTAIHIHTADSYSIIPLFICFVSRVKIKIFHSHNSIGRVNPLLHRILQMGINTISNKKLSCSEQASVWMYGKNQKQVRIIKNSIDMDKFTYNDSLRKKTRQDFNIREDQYVFIHTGRLTGQKNHSFLLKVFAELCKQLDNPVLFLAGDGELKDELIKLANELLIDDKVVFLGNRDDIQDILSASDILIFPSLYEGLPFSLVEAQANGIYCVISDKISKMSVLSDRIIYMSLSETCKTWAEKIAEIPQGYDRMNFKRTGLQYYDSKATVKELYNIYGVK